jgi:hypothetical protein
MHSVIRLYLKTDGNTAQRPPDGFVAHLPPIFSVILTKNSLTYASKPASFLANLTKNLTSHLYNNLCAVSPDFSENGAQ